MVPSINLGQAQRVLPLAAGARVRRLALGLQAYREGSSVMLSDSTALRAERPAGDHRLSVRRAGHRAGREPRVPASPGRRPVGCARSGALRKQLAAALAAPAAEEIIAFLERGWSNACLSARAGRRSGDQIIREVERAIVGKRTLLEQIMADPRAKAASCSKTHRALPRPDRQELCDRAGLDFKRIQFTPDLLPGDITRRLCFRPGAEPLRPRKGPVCHIILADEINRASPKTQSALLEAMQEYQVTLEGETMALPQPFIVLATQNPIEYEGTFPLPEAQLDRFIMKLGVGYPTPDEEREILRRRRSRGQDAVNLARITNADELGEMRVAVEEVHIEPDLERYIIDLVDATRHRRQVAVGASPRGSLALLTLTRAWAAIQGRDYELPDDIKRFVQPRSFTARS